MSRQLPFARKFQFRRWITPSNGANDRRADRRLVVDALVAAAVAQERGDLLVVADGRVRRGAPRARRRPRGSTAASARPRLEAIHRERLAELLGHVAERLDDRLPRWAAPARPAVGRRVDDVEPVALPPVARDLQVPHEQPVHDLRELIGERRSFGGSARAMDSSSAPRRTRRYALERRRRRDGRAWPAGGGAAGAAAAWAATECPPRPAPAASRPGGAGVPAVSERRERRRGAGAAVWSGVRRGSRQARWRVRARTRGRARGGDGREENAEQAAARGPGWRDDGGGSIDRRTMEGSGGGKQRRPTRGGSLFRDLSGIGGLFPARRSTRLSGRCGSARGEGPGVQKKKRSTTPRLHSRMVGQPDHARRAPARRPPRGTRSSTTLALQATRRQEPAPRAWCRSAPGSSGSASCAATSAGTAGPKR